MTHPFTLLERIGKGGMGAVWMARDADTGQTVALKLLYEQFADDPEYLKRFEREVDLARRIHSPHVVQVLGYGERDGRPYIAMELVTGQSLRDLLQERGKLPWDEARRIVLDVAEGLQAAHDAGVVHRDVKPSNILIDAATGAAKLADFGIARGSDLTRMTQSAGLLGTPHYMAPTGAETPGGDFYSLGCVLYEMLTGMVPFDGPTPTHVLLAHERDPVDLALLPPEARILCEALLDRDVRNRPVTVAALRRLAGAVSSSGIPVARVRRDAMAPPRVVRRKRVVRDAFALPLLDVIEVGGSDTEDDCEVASDTRLDSAALGLALLVLFGVICWFLVLIVTISGG